MILYSRSFELHYDFVIDRIDIITSPLAPPPHLLYLTEGKTDTERLSVLSKFAHVVSAIILSCHVIMAFITIK